MQLQQLGLKKQIELMKPVESKKEAGFEKKVKWKRMRPNDLLRVMTDNIVCGEKKEVEGCTKQIVEKVV